jgi:hypothetical protein
MPNNSAPYFRSDENEFKKILQRLFGFDGQLPPKLLTGHSDEANADDCEIAEDQ